MPAKRATPRLKNALATAAAAILLAVSGAPLFRIFDADVPGFEMETGERQ